MKELKKILIGSWKTSVLGLVAGVPPLITAIESGNKATIITAIATILLGLLAKDGDQTHTK